MATPDFRKLAQQMNAATPVSITQSWWRQLFAQVFGWFGDQLWKVPALLGDGTPSDARRLLGLEHVTIAWADRGDWQPGTDYGTNDLVWHGGTAYGALVSHHSGHDFQVDYSAGRWRIVGGSLLDELFSDTRNRVFILVTTGQSNDAGAHSGGPNPASPLVKTWDGATGTWGSSDYTQAPWCYGAPRGNGGNNNIGLSLAHRLADTYRARVYVIYDALGGRPISDWVGDGTASVRYAAIKAKVEAALASPELVAVGKTTVDYLLWAQGEEDDLTDDVLTYRPKFAALDTQFRGETWMAGTTPILVMGMSGLHQRYRVGEAQRDYCENVNRNCIYVNSAGLKTGYDVDPTAPGVDYTHWLGPSLWEAGYERAWDALQGRGVSHRSIVAPFYARSTGPYRGETIALAQFSSLVSYGSTTSQFPMNGPAASHAIHWGWLCVASNYSMAGGYQTTMDSSANYSAGWGRSLVFGTGAQYSAAHGFQNSLNAAYTFAVGRGHTVADQYGAAFGAFAEYVTPQADPVLLQVGNGTLSSPKTVFAVFGSGRTRLAGNLEFREDNKCSVGTPSARVSVFYGVTGNINQSDATTKDNISTPDDPLLRAWGKVRARVYQLRTSIEEKGEAHARLHLGFIAQDVHDALVSEGLDPGRYALFCEDEIFEEVMHTETRTAKRQKTVPGTAKEIQMIDGQPVLVEVDADILQFEEAPVVDENGDAVLNPETNEPLTHPVPVMEDYEEEVSVPVMESRGTRLGLRYDECLVLECAWLRARVDAMNARLVSRGR